MSSSSTAAALQLALSHLQGALTYTAESNIDTNKKLWNQYAKQYKEKKRKEEGEGEGTATAVASSSSSSSPSDWVLSMASAVSRDASQLEFLGDEWSDDASLTQCMEEFILPYIGVNRLSHSVCCESASLAAGCISHLPPSGLLSVGGSPIDSSLMTVAEIGVGGGRVATRVYKHVKHLYCLDIAEEMIQQAKESIAHAHTRQQQAIDKPSTDNESIASPSSTEPTLPSNISFHLLSSAPQFPPRLLGTCDFVYSFDVMPHIDLHTIYAYMKTIKGLLRPNPTGAEVSSRPRPRVFLHTANLCAPLGFDRFSKQTRPTAGGFHFLSPEMIRTLAKQCGYRIIQESRCNTDQMKQGEAGEETAEDNAFKAQQAQRAKNIYYQRDFLFVLEVEDGN